MHKNITKTVLNKSSPNRKHSEDYHETAFKTKQPRRPTTTLNKELTELRVPQPSGARVSED